MRYLLPAVFATAIAFSLSGASAATGHWYCTGDGIKSWTTDATMTDAHGWSYVGDRATYKADGHCQKS